MQLDIDRKGFITTNDIRWPAQNRTLIPRQSQLLEPTMMHGGSSVPVHPPHRRTLPQIGEEWTDIQARTADPALTPKPCPLLSRFRSTT